ncbi:HAD family hydrolase [Quadrisphaera sp. KR29]|uniref:HAD family hydrolase n=1 Tax=Quadrisphaera sp. KR29 TaxID=3461391 RepID=UPI0040447AA6
MGVRLVATDLDGTVVRADGSISARTRAAFEACRRAGVHVVAVTGRPPRWVVDLTDAFGPVVVVCANGAITFDLASGAVIGSRTVPAEAVLQAVPAVRRELPGVSAALETLAGFRHEPAYVPRYDARRSAVVGELPELLADDPGVVKLLLREESTPPDRLLDVVQRAAGHLVEPTHSGMDGLVEVSARGVSKASALAELAAGLGVPAADVAAFGDMPNDLPMLRWAGHSYAVGGAHPDVLAAARATAPPCEEDGVAQVLERLLELTP